MHLSRLTVFGLGALAFAACGGKPDAGPGGAASTTAAAASTSAPAGEAPSTSAAPKAVGPAVTIPAGRLVAGTKCGDHPRMPSDEPAGVSVDMTEYTIDAYPYPNDPAAPPLTGATQEEAEKYCSERGRRLCTDLEWERACKGPKNMRYEYGDKLDLKRCSNKQGTQPNDGPVGGLAECKSAFGVSAMHGYAFEWTKGSWGRGDDDASMGAARGGYGKQPFGDLRCTSVKQVKRDARDPSVGFRCCGGAENAAKVDAPKPEEHPVLEPVEANDVATQNRMISALANGSLKSDASTEYFVDKAWHWRPVVNEDLLVARVGARDVATKSVRYWPAVLELCPGVAQTSNKLKALVDEMGEPEAKTEPIKGGGPRDDRRLVTFSIKTGTESGEARLEYQYGQVAITQPAWVGTATPAPAAPASAAPSASAAPASAPAPAK